MTEKGAGSVMDLFDVASACRRRWYVVVPLLVLTAMAAIFAYFTVPTVYQASSVVGLGPSPTTGGEGNGILNNGGTVMLANVTAIGLSSPEVTEQIENDAGATEFTAEVVAVPGGQMPMVELTTRAHDLETAERALVVANERAQEEVNRIQADAGIGERSFGVVYQVSSGTEIDVLTPGRTRLLVGILGLGIVASVVIGFYWDLVLTGRRRRRRPDLANDTGTEAESGASSIDDSLARSE